MRDIRTPHTCICRHLSHSCVPLGLHSTCKIMYCTIHGVFPMGVPFVYTPFSSGSSGWVKGDKKPEIYAATFGGRLFFTGSGGGWHGPLDPPINYYLLCTGKWRLIRMLHWDPNHKPYSVDNTPKLRENQLWPAVMDCSRPYWVVFSKNSILLESATIDYSALKWLALVGA